MVFASLPHLVTPQSSMSVSLIRSALILSLTAGLGTAQVRIVQLDEVATQTTLRNFSSTATIDVSGYFLCREPNTYRQLANLPTVAGDLMLSPGEEVVIEYSFIPLAGGIGLFTTSLNFADPSNMVDYVQYGGVVGFREPVAVQAGFWDAGTFASGNSGPFLYVGDGMNDRGSDFWFGNAGTTFCTGNPNSSGLVASLSAMGSTVASPLNLSFQVANLPLAPEFGVLTFGPVQIPPILVGDGLLCIGGGVVLVGSAKAAAVSNTVSLDENAPYAAAIIPGVTLNFQYWFRDRAFGGAGFNFSDGLEITFQ